MLSIILRTSLISLLIISSTFALAKTRGTPLGGMGTGYVGYDATTGNFYTSGKTPPPAADGWNGADYNRKPSSGGFYFFANGQAVSKATTTDEDAKCPMYTASFSAVKGVAFTLTAFGPYLPGDNPDNFKLATSPLAFFEIAATNGNAAAVDVAAAMEFANGGLLGGANSGSVDGTQAISFAGTNDNAYLAVDCDGTSPAYSAGAIGTFTTAGTLANSDGNLVAAKCSVPADGTVRFKFTLSWWRKYETTNTGRYSNWDGKENYWYHNNFANSKDAAAFGRSKFDAVRNGITSFVSRTMASNFPDWYKDRLLNNTYPMIHNSQATKDGRLAFWEGLYGIIGTIDQGQHAALFYTFNWPEVQWKELNYWRSTTRKDFPGQIHHDFNIGISNFHSNAEKEAARFVCPLVGSNNINDYWWFKVNGVQNTNTWADLNMMFIFKAYELMLATGNKDSMTAYFPAIKQTAERIIAQCGSGSKLPLNCHSTYDESTDGGNTFNTSPEYNGGVVLPAYLAVSEIAKYIGQTDVAATYRGYYETGRAEYQKKYGNDIATNNYAKGRDCSEGDVAGYSWANYFCFEPVMDSAFITAANKKLWAYYENRTESGVDNLRAKLGKWGFYTCDHWGGTEIATGNPDRALVIHGWDHEYYFKDSPGMIFWQTLRKESGANKDSYASYMTGPTVWRSYFQMCGYLLDNANNRLWIRPRIPSSMNGKITNALLLNPKCLGTLNYEESAAGQCVRVSYDAPGATVSEIVLKNNTGSDTPPIKINGETVTTVTAENNGIEKNLRIKLASPITIGPDGITISVNGMECKTGTCSRVVKLSSVFPLSINNFRIAAGMPIRYSADGTGMVVMELLTLNGARIGTIMQKNVSAGEHTFRWDGKTLNGKRVGSAFVIVRLTSPAGSMTKTVFTGR
ncbi:MAG: hypothetical protein JXA18_15530 [Chitinispirillaceae bacterium]|nr:hypothetical protein [Chitinispirillaceae bacterium]